MSAANWWVLTLAAAGWTLLAFGLSVRLGPGVFSITIGAGLCVLAMVLMLRNFQIALLSELSKGEGSSEAKDR